MTALARWPRLPEAAPLRPLPSARAAQVLDSGGIRLVRAGRRVSLLLVQPSLWGGVDLVRPPVRQRGLRTARPRRRLEHHRDLFELQAALEVELYRRVRGGYVVETEHGPRHLNRRIAGTRRFRVLG